ncbi:hypothetical protein BG004_005996 [Podila humilis]|nr:hypothetical protein BG004_005996 [Podila humilis]
MFNTKHLLSGHTAIRVAAVARSSQTRVFSATSFRLQEQQQQFVVDQSAPTNADDTKTESSSTANDTTSTDTTAATKKTPFRSARYLRELENKAAGGGGGGGGGGSGGNNSKGRSGDRPPRRFNKGGDRGDNKRNRNQPPPVRFQEPPSIPYDTTKELQFADKVDWEVTSVFESRPVYTNVASGRGGVAQLGTAAINSNNNSNISLNNTSSDIHNTVIPGPAYSAEIVGVRSDGDVDPEVEQGLIQEFAALYGNKDKDIRKSGDVSLDNQRIAFYMTENYQEILNPRNVINRFNNGNVKHVASLKYEIGSDQVQEGEEATAGQQQQVEKSWKRLERLGGDYTRASDPRSLLSNTKTGKNGSALLETINPLIGQNQSIGLEDKKKLLKALEKGLGGY